MKIIFLNLLLFLVIQQNACNKQKSISQKNIYTDFGSCYDERETVKVLENCKGKIIKISDNLWAIQPEDTEIRRLGICQMHEELKKENLQIIFTGEIKKVAATERFAANPFKIKELIIAD